MTQPARDISARPRVPAAVTEYLGMVAVLAALLAAFGLTDEGFLTASNLTAIANHIPPTVIAATGMTFVLIIAGIDLSVGSVLALSGAVMGVCMVRWGLPLAAAIPLCLIAGLACGTINGLIVIAWRLPPFIVTLGMLEMARGATHLATGGETLYIGKAVDAITDTAAFGLSLPFYIAVAIVALAQMVLSSTVFGRYMLAVGTNEEAVRLSGVSPRRVKLAVFMICGLLAGVAAVIQTSRQSSADPNAGTGFELEVIAAVVIGGTSLMGGRGSVVRSFFGVIIIAVLGNGLAVLAVGDPVKRLITGAVIVAAVILDYYRRGLGRSTS